MDETNKVERLEIAGEGREKVFVMGRNALAKFLGTAQLFSVGFGDVGSSIYYALGVTALFALGATPLAILIAGMFFACTVFTYAELASAYPEAGGSQIFARRAFGDLVSFTAGWALLLDYVLTIAISAYTISPYLAHLLNVEFSKEVQLWISLALILMLTTVNIFGIKESGRLSLVLALISIVSIVAVISIGGYFLFDFDKVFSGMAAVGHEPTWGGFLHGLSLAMVAYTGIEATAQLSGESRDPSRNIPRAMILVLVSVLIMYLGVSLVAFSAMSPQELTTNFLENPMAGIASKVPKIGPFLARWISLLGIIVLTIAANAGILGASRLAYSMGGNFQIPRIFVKIHPVFKTPHLALIFFSGVAGFILLTTRRLDILADLYNFGAMLAFFLAHLSLIGLRVRDAETPRPFKAPFEIPFGRYKIPLTAIIGLLATFSVWLIVVFKHPYGRFLGFSWILFGFAIYFYYRRKAKLPAVKTLEIEKIEIKEFKEVSLKKILMPCLGGEDTEAVQFASTLAKDFGADVLALYVIEAKAQAPLDIFYPEEFMKADTAMERAEAVAHEIGVPSIETKIIQSRGVGETIVEFARDGGFDLIVMPAKVGRGPAPLDAALSFVGRTVDHVIKNAPCRVLVLRS